jgi:hypothetical protein
MKQEKPLITIRGTNNDMLIQIRANTYTQAYEKVIKTLQEGLFECEGL